MENILFNFMSWMSCRSTCRTRVLVQRLFGLHPRSILQLCDDHLWCPHHHRVVSGCCQQGLPYTMHHVRVLGLHVLVGPVT
jgi:hypothetical protein